MIRRLRRADKGQRMAHAVAVVRATAEAREDVDKVVAQRVADALMMRDRAAHSEPAAVRELRDRVRSLEQRMGEVERAAYNTPDRDLFMAQRVAWHLGNGCDTAQRAREVALAEWDAGVLGVVK